jgi:hypothetical protein
MMDMERKSQYPGTSTSDLKKLKKLVEDVWEDFSESVFSGPPF